MINTGICEACDTANKKAKIS